MTDCVPGCRCRCNLTACGCHAPTGLTDPACAYASAGIRCRLCNGPARVQRVESQLQGKPVGLIWCPKCDTAAEQGVPA